MARGCAAGECPKVSSQPTLDEIRAFVAQDKYATETGCEVVEGWDGHGVCRLKIDAARHHNAQGYVMGGAIFTLADCAFSVACMCGACTGVSLTSDIEFIKGARGGTLTATCDRDSSGNRVGFYTVCVRDDAGDLVAKLLMTCYHPTPSR